MRSRPKSEDYPNQIKPGNQCKFYVNKELSEHLKRCHDEGLGVAHAVLEAFRALERERKGGREHN